MAVSLRADAAIYDPRTQIEFKERISQFVELFNEASAGAIRLVTAYQGADFDYGAIWSQPSVNPVSRRDLTSIATVTDQKLTQAQKIGVKINRKFGPLAMSYDVLRKIGEDISEDDDPMDLIMTRLGENAAVYTLQDKVNNAIAVAAAAIRVNAGAVSDLSAGVTPVSADALNTTFFKRGDRFSDIKTVVMHSAKAAQLFGGQITSNVTGIASLVIAGEQALCLGRKLIISDSPALVITGAPNKYITLGLADQALTVTDSEGELFFSQLVTGAENVYFRAQGEYAYTVDVNGYSWNVGAGGINPTDAALGTGTNWVPYINDAVKNGPGVALITQ